MGLLGPMGQNGLRCFAGDPVAAGGRAEDGQSRFRSPCLPTVEGTARVAGRNDLSQVLLVSETKESGGGLRTNRFAESILRLQAMRRRRDRAQGTQVPLVRPGPSSSVPPAYIPPDLLEELQDMFDLLDERS